MKEFKTWHDIKKWAEDNGFKNIAKRLQINSDYWWSCGEFGRSQVLICDTLRFAESEEERLKLAKKIEKSLKDDIMLQLT